MLDDGCTPVAGALVDFWQADDNGRYPHPADPNPARRDPNFQGWGHAVTDADGRYGFLTIKPAAYPLEFPDGRPDERAGYRTPHIHFRVAGRGFRELSTQICCAGEPLNGSDSVLKGIPAADWPRAVIDLGGASAAPRFAATGANPVRPHMVLFNSTHSHAILSFVSSGHILVMDAATRTPDDSYIPVANQNGKLPERIARTYATNTNAFEPNATLDLATRMTPMGIVAGYDLATVNGIGDVSPSGHRVFSLTRGPHSLAGDPHASIGDQPGLAVIGGRARRRARPLHASTSPNPYRSHGAAHRRNLASPPPRLHVARRCKRPEDPRGRPAGFP